jgi:hypothetical protein
MEKPDVYVVAWYIGLMGQGYNWRGLMVENLKSNIFLSKTRDIE